MFKKIICLAVVALTLFSLAACTGSLDDYKAEKISELEACVEALDKADYVAIDWTAIEQIADTGKCNIDAAKNKVDVNMALVTAKNEINAVLTEEQKMSDFILTISTEKTTLLQGEDFQVEMVFKNNSGETIEISHASSWILPFIAEWFEIESPLDIQLSILEVDEVVEISFKVSCEMPKGQHELKATAAFSIRQFGAEKLVPAKQKTIKSNTIIIVVA